MLILQLEQVIYDDLQPVLQVDAALNSHPIVQSVDNPDQINQLFDSVSYDKVSKIVLVRSEEVQISGLMSEAT